MRQFFCCLLCCFLRVITAVSRPPASFTLTLTHTDTLSHIDTQHDKLTVEWRSNSFVVILQNTHLKFIVLVIVVFVDIYYYRIVFVVVIEIVGACRAHLIALDVPTFIKIADVVVIVVSRLWQ